MVINILNPSTQDYEKTYLANAISSSTTQLTVKNNNSFATNDRIMIGNMGSEKTEVKTVSSVSGVTAIISSATSFSHEADTPITILRFDQIKIYRSIDGEDGAYSLLTTIDIDVDNDTLQTAYDDTSGESGFYYKVAFYHSISTLTSEVSDPIMGGTGWKRNQVGYIVDEFLQEVGDKRENFVTRAELVGYMNDVNDDLISVATRPFNFLRTREAFSRTANLNYINFPTDSYGDDKMWKFDRMDYNYTDTTVTPNIDETYTIPVIGEEEFRNKYQDNTISSTTVDDKVIAMCIDTATNKFRYYPPSETGGTAVFYLYYWKYFERVDSEGQEIETLSPRIYKLYFRAMFYKKRAVTEPRYQETADRVMGDYVSERDRYHRHNRKDAGTPRSFSRETRTIRSFRRV